MSSRILRCTQSMCSVQAAKYLDAIAGMEVGLQSMEVVSCLLAHPVPLPGDFLRAYIANCIAYCQAMQVRSSWNYMLPLPCLEHQIADYRSLLPVAFCAPTALYAARPCRRGHVPPL